MASDGTKKLTGFLAKFRRPWRDWPVWQRCGTLIALLALIVGATAAYLDALSVETRKVVAAAVIGVCAVVLALLTLGNVRKRPARSAAPPGKRGWEPELVLAEVDLRNATLPNARLEKSEITNAVLAGANLSGATLEASLLAGSDLQGADLRGADLRRADLRGADMRDAKTAGAKFGGATYDDETQWPEGRAHAGAIRIETAKAAR